MEMVQQHAGEHKHTRHTDVTNWRRHRHREGGREEGGEREGGGGRESETDRQTETRAHTHTHIHNTPAKVVGVTNPLPHEEWRPI